ncbi:sensor histidine kinase [Bombilactobacillus bombi]|uniref:sensor histidine kinase n=1 Tax=Bombilactobacillus bombi TaxID=1303590 RepID=UPI0015E61624|nr:sensor histidine kinase [Bombilactobacillus bombi]MBA1435124.1 sensor histidine kinase [Bombilactobacillus bombi]
MFKHNRFIIYGRYQRIFVAAICIALASQINISIFTPGFIVALSPLIMPIFLYFNADLNPIQLMLAISLASPIFRGLLLFISHENSISKIITYVLADIAFYVCYGFLYYILYWRRGMWNNSSFLFTIIICDYIANILEVSILINFSHYTYQLFQALFLTALIRSLCSCTFAFLYHYLTLMIRQENHEQRYYHFIWIASSVKSEVYFMKKNINEIENIMKNAYLLNQNLQKSKDNLRNRQMSLAIAHDVHELKKDYQNLAQSLGNYFNDEDTQTPMKFTDILRVVTTYVRITIKQNHQNIALKVQNNVELRIPNHYYIVSILSNLVFNSVDALKGKTNGKIQITAEDQNEDIIINVSDNGAGIDKEVIPLIFEPGFTTKYNINTGNVYRGIGLSHVKTIIQEQFNGHIVVESKINKGTNMKVILNKQRLLQGEIK